MERGDVRLLIEAQARLNQGEGRLPVTNLTLKQAQSPCTSHSTK